MDELDQALLKLRRAVERGVHVKLNRAATLTARSEAPALQGEAVTSPSEAIAPTSVQARIETTLWARLGEIARGRFRR